jgi:hypothetical protein
MRKVKKLTIVLFVIVFFLFGTKALTSEKKAI